MDVPSFQRIKRSGNRRYYQHHEVMLIRRIRELLYGQGFTISGARNLLENPNQATGRAIGLPAATLNVAALRHEIQEIINLLSV